MKKIMLLLAVILSLGLSAQKAPDFKTQLTALTAKIDEAAILTKDYTIEQYADIASGKIQIAPSTLENLASLQSAVKGFVATFYPNGFVLSDFLKRVQNEGFNGCKIGCSGAYFNCIGNCGGGGQYCQVVCQLTYNACIAGCQTIN